MTNRPSFSESDENIESVDSATLPEGKREVVDAIGTMIDLETGERSAGVGKILLEVPEIESLIAHDNKMRLDPTGSYIHTTAIVGNEASDALTKAALARDLEHSSSELDKDHLHARKSADPVEQLSKDTRPFVGKNLSYKWKPKGLPNRGKNPTFNGEPGLRQFIGDEFPRMLGYGQPKLEQHLERSNGIPTRVTTVAEEARPAFWSHFFKINADGTPKLDEHGRKQPIESLEDLKGQKLKINIATAIPEYMKKGTVAASMEGHREFAFGGNSLDDSFITITDKVEKAWRRFAKDFQDTYGIEVDVRKDTDPDAHPADEINLSVLGFQKGEKRLAGMSSFPVAMNDWAQHLGVLGHQQGFMLLNHEYTNNELIDDSMVYDLVAHEFGHFMGWVHPHDLGAMDMSQADALSSTVMAYTDGKFTRFQNQDNQLQDGAVLGPVDLYFRNFVPNPPKLNDARGTVYDLGKHSKYAHGENWSSRVKRATGQIPAVPIVNNGTGAVLVGTAGNDILDTEPGHQSIVRDTMGVQQRFALVEGHFAKVIGLNGNNEIFTSSRGDQEIHPGPGQNNIHIYPQNIGGQKTIISTGRDTLILHEDIFLKNRIENAGKETEADKRLKVEAEGNDLIISTQDGSGRIVLKDQLLKEQGIAAIKVVDDQGRTHVSRDVSRFTTPDRFFNGIVEAMSEETEELLKIRRSEARRARQAEREGGHEDHGHTHLLPDAEMHQAGPSVTAEKSPRLHAEGAKLPASTHLERIQQRAAENKAAKDAQQGGPGL